MPFSRLFVLLSAIISLATPVQLLAEAVEVKFFTPKRTGDAYWMQDVRSFHSKQVATLNGELNKHREEAYSTTFEANVTVIKNNAVGRAIEERFEILNFTLTAEGKEPQVLLEPGTIIFGYLDLGKKVFAYADGNRVTPEVNGYLNTIIALRDNSITDQDTFGPKNKVSPGESWSVNTALMAEDLNFDQSLITDKKNIKGELTLLEVKDVDGKPYAHIENTSEISRIKLPKNTGMNALIGELKYTVNAWLPLEAKVYPLEQTVSTELKLIFEPLKQSQFERRQFMTTTKIEATVKAKELPHDPTAATLDRTLGIRR